MARLGAWLLDALILGIVLLPLNPVVYGGGRPNPDLFFPLGLAGSVVALLILVAFDGGSRGATREAHRGDRSG